MTPGIQTENLILPATHTFQRIIKSGDVLTTGEFLGGNLDFTAYVPISGSSTNGYLSINRETTPAQLAILNISFNSGTQLWNVTNSGNVPFSVGTTTSDLGAVGQFCSGTVTSDNTVIIGEETTASGNVQSSVDSYEDVGWLIEIDPATRTVKDYNSDGKADKLWAMGRQAHENLVIKSDKSVVYWGADNGALSYMYKFVPTTPGNYTTGLLYVLETTSLLNTGTWKPVPNTTAAELNNTVAASTAAGAYNFDGIEDVEIGPDGKIYFAAKGPGRIYCFIDNGTTVNNLRVFVEKTTYDVDPGAGVSTEAWGIGNDNLAFDGEGNLWVLQDGDRSYIWVVGPNHTATSPAVRLFAKTPVGCEPTGITFSPDYKFIFISFMHPAINNITSQTDAAGISLVFNTSTTVVIAVKENLGPSLGVVPVTLTSFGGIETKFGNKLNWETSSEQNNDYFLIEHSLDGNTFNSVAKIKGGGTTNEVRKYEYLHQVTADINYYRLAIIDFNGHIKYSKVIRIANKNQSLLTILPNPVKSNIYLKDFTISAGERYEIINALGHVIQKGNLNSNKIFVQLLPQGIYYLKVYIDGDKKPLVNRFLKQ